MRLDVTLVGLEGMKWKRGHLSFLYLGDGAKRDEVLAGRTVPAGSLLVYDRVRKVQCHAACWPGRCWLAVLVAGRRLMMLACWTAMGGHGRRAG